MGSVFTMIIEGELPGRFVWKDELCVAFLSINPLAAGHTLVVPRQEVDHWIDLDPDLASHLMAVSQKLGLALNLGFKPKRIALMIAGLEVPHTHLHVVPIEGIHDLDADAVDLAPDPDALDAAADRVRAALRALGHPEVSD
ncbi:MAG: HIT family protein [Acidimicrobiia bacterium]|nr:HIT family protein [Acidimicrobiia bacterium]MDX2468128.1 HIT family protein [Acidimicrobiia bacterium]